MNRRRRQPVHTQDHDGQEIVLVPLANHDRPAKLFAADWDRLMREKVSPYWTLNSGDGIDYVRCNAKAARGLQVTARLVMRASAGQVVGYRSEDRLNLRADNLRVKQRSVGGRQRRRSAQATPPEVRNVSPR